MLYAYIMIVSTCQPYFAPFPGFFTKILQSDVVVLLDTVQFPQGTTWLTRNRWKSHQGTLWLTVPVWKKGLGLQRISDVKICYEGQWSRKHLASLKTAYRHAPYFEDHEAFCEEIFSCHFEKLVDLNHSVITYLLKHLHIKTQVMSLSALGIEAKEPRLTIEICRRVGGTAFLVRRSAGKHFDSEIFENEGIELMYVNPNTPIYPQLWGQFIPNLSAFDLLFNCGPKGVAMMTGYRS